MKSYASHLVTTRDLHKIAVPRKPVFRSSAIFPAINSPETKTRLCFLGYWKIKRNVAEIASVVTVRSEEGQLISRTNQVIRDARAFRIELADQLAAGGLNPQEPFRGSIEIEFFATVNLVFPYPAVLVNYYGPQFSSFVHTAQRVFNDVEDAGENLETPVPESGFNIYSDGDREPCFAFVNGFEEVKNCKVGMTFYNCDREELRDSFTLPELRPFQTVFVRPSERVDLRTFLKGKVGAGKVTFNSRWVFPRIIAGNWQNSLHAFGVTHTYYDCTAAGSDSDYWHITDPGYHPAVIELPLMVKDDFYTNIYFYPIISPSVIEIDVEIYSIEGKMLGRRENVLRIESPATQYFQIRLKEVVKELRLDPEAAHADMTVQLIARPVEGSRLPTRIKVGLDLGRRDDRLPCNICTNFSVYDPGSEKRDRAFHWAPLLADQDNAFIWILNGSNAIDYRKQTQVKLSFFREADTCTVERTITLAPHGAAIIQLKDDPQLQSFFGGAPGWCTMVADSPHMKSFYFVEHSSGMFGGDHSF